MDEITFSRMALSALKFRIPEGDIDADLGEGEPPRVLWRRFSLGK